MGSHAQGREGRCTANHTTTLHTLAHTHGDASTSHVTRHTSQATSHSKAAGVYQNQQFHGVTCQLQGPFAPVQHTLLRRRVVSQLELIAHHHQQLLLYSDGRTTLMRVTRHA